MKQDEILMKIRTTVAEQRKAEHMMLAAIVRAADVGVLQAALDAAMSTTGLIIPTGMSPTHGHILSAIWDLLDADPPLTPITPEAVEERTYRDYRVEDDDGGYAADSIARLWQVDPEPLTAVEWGTRVAKFDLAHWSLGQQVWPEALYEWFDYDGRLLYIGITRDLAARQESHSRRSSWGQFAIRCTVERYPTREDVESMERRLIAEKRPLFNHVHNDTPEARQRLVEYLVEKGRLDLLAPAVSRG